MPWTKADVLDLIYCMVRKEFFHEKLYVAEKHCAVYIVPGNRFQELLQDAGEKVCTILYF